MQAGDIVEKYNTRYQLKSYVREATADLLHNPNGRIILSKDSNTWAFEYWLCTRLSDGIDVICNIQKPSQPPEDNRSSCDEGYDRLPGQFINDKWEVNLLTDSYEEYIDNQRDLKIVDPILKKKNKEFRELVDFIGSQCEAKNLRRENQIKTGFKLLWYHRQCPTWTGYKVYQKWCRENPKYFIKMQKIINDWLKSKQEERRGSAESI